MRAMQFRRCKVCRIGYIDHNIVDIQADVNGQLLAEEQHNNKTWAQGMQGLLVHGRVEAWHGYLSGRDVGTVAHFGSFLKTSSTLGAGSGVTVVSAGPGADGCSDA